MLMNKMNISFEVGNYNWYLFVDDEYIYAFDIPSKKMENSETVEQVTDVVENLISTMYKYGLHHDGNIVDLVENFKEELISEMVTALCYFYSVS